MANKEGTMKTVFLLRHAKSSWSDPSLADFNRPLNSRGKKDATLMGRFFAEKNIYPELVLSSSSTRTRETMFYVEGALAEKLTTFFIDDLYHASSSIILNIIQNASPNLGSLMIVAHNPGMHDAALRFLGYGELSDIERLDYKYPTAGFAEFTFRAEIWPDVKFGEGKLERLVFPKDF